MPIKYSRRQVLVLAGAAAALLLSPILLSVMPDAHASVPAAGPEEHFRPGEILVKFKPIVPPFLADSLLEVQGFRPLTSLNGINLRRVGVTPGNEPLAVDALKNNPLVEYAELNYMRRPLFTPDDSLYSSSQWNQRGINMEQAWDITRGSITVTVATIDTGLDMTNPDGPDSLVSPHDVCSGGADMSDRVGHGTHVSGIIAANTNNALGVASVAPGVSLMPVKVECQGAITVLDESAGIIYATDHGARVLNISLGGSQPSWAEQDTVNYAVRKGLLLAAAAGNEYQQGNPVSYPAAYPGVLAVGASTHTDARAYYSQVQPYVAVLAPGGNPASSLDADPTHWIMSTYISPTNYVQMAGTSMAAPHVAALAGLIWSVKPELTSAQVTNIITSTAVDLGPPGKDDATGWGRVDAYAALTRARDYDGSPAGSPTPTVTPTSTPTARPGTLRSTVFLPEVQKTDASW